MHNALLVEQKKEALLIEESFHAIKTAKAKLREENLCRAQASTAAYERETRILEGMIVKLQQVAEMAGILLDDAITVEQNTIGFTNSAENFQLSRPALLFPAAWLSRLDAVLAQATVPDRPAYVHAASDVQRRPLGSGMQQRVEKDLRDYINSRVHSKNERTLPDRTHKETPHVRHFVQSSQRTLTAGRNPQHRFDQILQSLTQNAKRWVIGWYVL